MLGFGRHTIGRHIKDWNKKVEKLYKEFQRNPHSAAIVNHAEDVLVDYEEFIIWLRDHMLHNSDFAEFQELVPVIRDLGVQIQNLVREIENRNRELVRETGMDTAVIPLHDWEHTQMIPIPPVRQRKLEENDVTTRLELKERFDNIA